MVVSCAPLLLHVPGPSALLAFHLTEVLVHVADVLGGAEGIGGVAEVDVVHLAGVLVRSFGVGLRGTVGLGGAGSGRLSRLHSAASGAGGGGVRDVLWRRGWGDRLCIIVWCKGVRERGWGGVCV